MMKGGLGNLMKQAQQMQENMKKMQEQLASVEVEGQSGAGMVKVIMTCRYDCKRVTIDLAEAFDLGRPGRYELQPRILLHDVHTGAAVPPRPRALHVPQPLDCPAGEFILAG